MDKWMIGILIAALIIGIISAAFVAIIISNKRFECSTDPDRLMDFVDIPANATGESYPIESLRRQGAFLVGCAQGRDDYYFTVLVRCDDGSRELLELSACSTKIFVSGDSPHIEIIPVDNYKDLMFRLYLPEEYEFKNIA